MSRITFEELFTIDVEWYGIDRVGNIAVFCSAGKANVPEFVCADKERYALLIDLVQALPPISNVQFYFECSTKNSLPLQVAKEFSEKGLFYYDSDDHSKAKDNISVLQSYYTKSSAPVKPLLYKDLPKQLQELLKDHFLPVDNFETNSMIEIDNAYIY